VQGTRKGEAAGGGGVGGETDGADGKAEERHGGVRCAVGGYGWVDLFVNTVDRWMWLVKRKGLYCI